jgi:DNA (cytosine-5)-methyltransferase 1
VRVLDLFCGAGGAAMGLHRAWPDTEIMGVDIANQPHYPFKFVRGDVMHYLDGALRGFDFIWASPVCKRYTKMTNCRPGVAATHPDWIFYLQQFLRRSQTPYVIENVVGSPLDNPVMLCGSMFGMEIYRHRLFETSFPISPPEHSRHSMKASRAGHWKPGTVMSVAGNFSPVSHARQIMGIDWMTRDELSQAIPPSYSEYIAKQYDLSLEVPNGKH